MPDSGEAWYARPVCFVTDCDRAHRFYAKLMPVEAISDPDGNDLLLFDDDLARS